MSSKGYGVLWNNYGLTDFNPAEGKVVMDREEGEGEARRVNVTSTEGRIDWFDLVVQGTLGSLL